MMQMQNSVRVSECRTCGHPLQIAMDLGAQYPVCFPEHQVPAESVQLYPLELAICTNRACALVQLTEHVRPELLFRDHYWYRSGINPSMVQALHNVVGSACFKQALSLQPGDWVVDIGANDGTLLNQYKLLGVPVKRVAFEPATNLAEAVAQHAEVVVHDFFPPAAGIENVLPGNLLGRAKIITAIAMAYDLPNPNQFFHTVADLLAPDGLFVVQLGYVGDMLAMNSFDQICHEHIEYYSLTSLCYLLKRQGLIVEDVERNSVNGGSLRCYVRHARSGARSSAAVVKLIAEEEDCGMHTMEPYALLEGRVLHLKDRCLEIIDSAQGEAYVYGASTKGLTTMQTFGLTSKHFAKAVERDEQKWGRLYGHTGIEIVPEESWRGLPPRLTLVPIWHFRDGIEEREREWLGRGGEFLFPIPKGEVVRG